MIISCKYAYHWYHLMLLERIKMKNKCMWKYSNTYEKQMYVKIFQDWRNEEIPRLFYLSVFASSRR